MVSVVALKNFEHDGEPIHRGQAVWMSPIDAAWRARKGLVTLTKGARPTYHTREMVPEPLPVVEFVDVQSTTEETGVTHNLIEPAPEPVEPPKRRRGRPRKTKTS
jgi:hypothetical protein